MKMKLTTAKLTIATKLAAAAMMLSLLATSVLAMAAELASAEITATTLPPVVIKTVPEAGSLEVPAGEFEIKITFSKAMTDQSWSWCTVWDNSTPEGIEAPKYDDQRKTCSLRVKLEPGKVYGYWLNTKKFQNFRDQQGRSAVPYLLTFSTSGQALEAEAGHPAGFMSLLNDDQRTIVNATDQRFHDFFDTRDFSGWPAADRNALERKLLETLKSPTSPEYYHAINSLAALGSTQALSALRRIAFDHAEKDNRDRWMATRALGIIGDKESVPDLIHLLYHFNANTRWWAQISLVRTTGTNFGKDWKAWGNWWSEQNGRPPFQPGIIRWSSEQPEPDKLAEKIQTLDNDFLTSLSNRPPQTGEPYLQQQLKQAQAGNYWAKFNLWEAFAQGQHGVAKNSAEADKWLAELVKGAYLAKFKPVNGFNPKNPSEMLDQFNEHCHLYSGKDRLGGASFFRTTKQDDKLIGSFLTATPDEFKAAVQQNPDLELISIEQVTPEMFLAHEASPQESL